MSEKKLTTLFFDLEFTGLTKGTSIISIGIVSDCGQEFYAEMTDYDRLQVDEWIKENVIKNLSIPDDDRLYIEELEKKLRDWLTRFGQIEMWGSCLAYKWVLFCDIFGGEIYIPENITYIPFDICTLMKLKGVDPYITREAFAGVDTDTGTGTAAMHNALHDARVVKLCYEKLTGLS